jgi:hypothetical protein
MRTRFHSWHHLAGHRDLARQKLERRWYPTTLKHPVALGIGSVFIWNGVVDYDATRDGERRDLDQLVAIAARPCLEVE